MGGRQALRPVCVDESEHGDPREGRFDGRQVLQVFDGNTEVGRKLQSVVSRAKGECPKSSPLSQCIRFVIANSSLRLSLQVGLLTAAAEKKAEECETRP
jgi:hypothetical protein